MMLRQPWCCELCHTIAVTKHVSSAAASEIARVVRADHKAYSPYCRATGEQIRLTATIPDARKILQGTRAVALCAICGGDESPGEVRDVDGKRMFVCDRCEHEHSRVGNYTFDEAKVTGKVSRGQAMAMGWKAPKRGR